jgi:hypothetical protein
MSFDSLFQCFYNKKNDLPKRNMGEFTLVIDKRISNYPYALKQEYTRISLLDIHTKYLNSPETIASALPPVFIKKRIKGNFMSDVIHPDVAPFYKNLVLSTIQESNVVKLHIVLNDVHILLTAYPILDNKRKIIGCTLLETPYLNVMESSTISNSFEYTPNRYY